MRSISADVTSMRTAHTKNETYKPSPELHAKKFGPASVRFEPGFVDSLSKPREGYDPALSYALSLVSGWSYSDGQTLANKLKSYGLEFASVEEISVTNPAMLIVSSAFLARSPSGQVGILSFRGTDPTNAINWLVDTDVLMRPFGEGKSTVHRGFYANTQAIWEEILAKLEHALQRQGKTNGESELLPLECLYITGHSLGAAMAVIATAKIFMDGRPELKRSFRGLYTYGQPAVGNEQFKAQCHAWFGERMHRHVFAFDAVARLPPASTGRFEHFGVEHFSAAIDEPWKPADRPVSLAPFVVAAVVVGGLSFIIRRLPALARLKLPFLEYSLEDHSPTGYIEASRVTLQHALGLI